MEPYADVTCALSINMDCQACKMTVLEVLSSIIGVYSVDIDANKGEIMVSGEVDPNVLLKAITRTGKHAKLAWVKLNHPGVHRTYHGLYNYSHGALEDPCYVPRYRRPSAAFPGWALPPYNCPPSSRFRPFC